MSDSLKDKLILRRRRLDLREVLAARLRETSSDVLVVDETMTCASGVADWRLFDDHLSYRQWKEARHD